MNDTTTIEVKTSTRDRMLAKGKMGETFDQLINRLLDDPLLSCPHCNAQISATELATHFRGHEL